MTIFEGILHCWTQPYRVNSMYCLSIPDLLMVKPSFYIHLHPVTSKPWVSSKFSIELIPKRNTSKTTFLVAGAFPCVARPSRPSNPLRRSAISRPPAGARWGAPSMGEVGRSQRPWKTTSQPLTFWVSGGFSYGIPSGNLTKSYWKWSFIVDFPTKNCDFP